MKYGKSCLSPKISRFVVKQAQSNCHANPLLFIEAELVTSNHTTWIKRSSLAEDLSVQVNDGARPRDGDVWVLLVAIAAVFLPSMYKGE
jgi:hypothetical protein